MADQRARVAVVVGYFDWFSGYQEVALAAALSAIADTEIIASDRVNPTFSDSHLKQLGISRRYQVGSTVERGVKVTRFPSIEMRAMVWSSHTPRYLAQRSYDLLVQVMPGQMFSVAATLTPSPTPRVILYGDNKAMWSHLPRWKRWIKGAVFAVTKGVLYTAVNARALVILGYTPDTVRRLRPFRAGRPFAVLPLTFSPEYFYLDSEKRRLYRDGLGLCDDDVLLVAAGKIEGQKRLDWLISAFDSLAAQRHNLHLLLIGAKTSEYSGGAAEALRTSPFRERIHVRPFSDSAGLNAAFNGADIGVWPRNPAITIQQAMGTGLAVLLPRNDLVGHLIKPGSGHYYELQETQGVKSLCEGLAHALDHTDYGSPARRHREETNRWLSANAVARDLLEMRTMHEHTR